MGFVNSMIILSIIIINQFVLDLSVAATDVLRQGDELNTSSILVSAGGNLTLGFYSIYIDSYYVQTAIFLGIWYTDDQAKKALWVANHDKPMFSEGALMIDESGTLKVIKGDGSNTALFNVSINNSNEVGFGNGNTIAVLEDSGNFVLYDNANRTLWQSFDHPTDTLLPGMKLGYNLTTRQNWTLTSWFSDQIPASGAFTMSLENFENTPQLVIRRHGNVYWTSGAGAQRDGTCYFSNLPLDNGIVDAYVVNDASGMYFAFSKKSVNGIPMMQLSSLGELIEGGTTPLTPNSCYGYANDRNYGGCAISPLPKCRDKYDSLQLEHGSWDGQMIHSNDGHNISFIDCMDVCWNNCKCRGFSIENGWCYTWGLHRADFSYEQTSPTKVGILRSLKVPKKNISKMIWVVSAAIVLASIFASFLCYVRIRRRRLEEMRRDDYILQLTGSHSFNYGDELEKGIKDAPDVKIFSLKAISAATHNFSNENKLGQGGYGPVYKGILFDGRQIAVKRLSKTSGQGIEEFKSELILISKLQHTNLVRLYGCCIHQEEKMLIYEFMPNKSLDFFLFAEDKKDKIDWQMRFNIIEGVAHGLLYLHKYSRMRVIHRDLKVSNVLLDENMNPKIADFGMARIFKRDVTEEITNRVVGTYGYMAPEYAMRGTFSIKSDVFSFGVLILEIISGKRNSRFYSKFYSLDRTLDLLGYAWELWKAETSLELKDESLGESYDLNQLLRTIHVGLLCVQENADDRPTIPEVISMLNNEIANLPSPKQPAFFTGTPLVEATDYLLDKNIPASINGLTITKMEAR